LIVSRTRAVSAHSLIALVLTLAACAPLGMTLPTDDIAPPPPDGGRIKPTLGWLSTKTAQGAGGAPEGSIEIKIVRSGHGAATLQQVRHYRKADGFYGDSVILDRNTLRPIETFRWTPAGTYIARYNHRTIERIFEPVKGSPVRSAETLDVEPYSYLGIELVIAALPLGAGYPSGMLPVAVDTASRGWGWLKFTLMQEQSIAERPDQKPFDVWIVDCESGPGPVAIGKTRLYIAIDGRSVRKIEYLTPDNEVLGTLKRMLLAIPIHAKVG
jgi:hypothetical protein